MAGCDSLPLIRGETEIRMAVQERFRLFRELQEFCGLCIEAVPMSSVAAAPAGSLVSYTISPNPWPMSRSSMFTRLSDDMLFFSWGMTAAMDVQPNGWMVCTGSGAGTSGKISPA